MNVIPFEFESKSVRVVKDEHGEPWFVAADVCKALALDNVTKALARLDADEQALISIQGISRGNDQANVVNESGCTRWLWEAARPKQGGSKSGYRSRTGYGNALLSPESAPSL